MEDKKRWWDWSAGLIVIFLVGVVAARLSVTNWSPNLWMMDILAFFGVILGLMLGASKFKPRSVILISAAYTVFFVIWQLGLSLNQKVQWSAKLSILFDRIWGNIDLFFKDIPVTDPLLFLFSIGMLVWVVSLVTGYRMARYGKPWWSIIVLTVLLIVVDYYHPFLIHRNRYTGIFFFLIVLLIARLFLLRMRQKWAEDHVMEDSETGINLAKWAIAISLFAVAVAWSMPIVVQALTLGSPVQRRLDKSWKVLRDRLSNMVAGLTNTSIQVTSFYGNSINLGNRAASGNDVIFNIAVPDTEIAQDIRYYWRSRSYDQFTGVGWVTSSDEKYLNPADDWQVKSEEFDNQIGMSLIVNSLIPLSRTIVSPGNPINFNRAVQVEFAAADEGEVDILGLAAEPPLSDGESYRAQVRIANPTIKQLRETSVDYPTWVKERYLVLPEDVAPRILELAAKITTGLENPYDKADAITRYLRRTITFTETVAKPPAGADLMEWFLFDYQKGFCNYYASAEVILLRAVGVPARLSVGFAEGEFTEEKSIFTVRRRDSHAWPEVYFVGVGWIEFEPTTSQPERVLPNDLLSQSDDLGEHVYPAPIILDGEEVPKGLKDPLNTDSSSQENSGQIRSKELWVLVIFLILGILAITILRYLPRKTGQSIWIRLENYLQKRRYKIPAWLEKLTKKREKNQLNAMIRWIDRILLWSGKKTKAGMTPAEKVSLLVETLPEAEEPGRIFLHEYELAEYSEHPFDLLRAQKAGRQIIRIFLDYSFRRLFGY